MGNRCCDLFRRAWHRWLSENERLDNPSEARGVVDVNQRLGAGVRRGRVQG
jgi:hypothetical protein